METVSNDHLTLTCFILHVLCEGHRLLNQNAVIEV